MMRCDDVDDEKTERIQEQEDTGSAECCLLEVHASVLTHSQCTSVLTHSQCCEMLSSGHACLCTYTLTVCLCTYTLTAGVGTCSRSSQSTFQHSQGVVT